jgi:hypothetical protein
MAGELFHLANQAAARPGFVAHKLAEYQQAKQIDDAALAKLLGCTLDDLTHLRLCSVPRTEAFEEDTATIAAHTHVTNVEVLSDILHS